MCAVKAASRGFALSRRSIVLVGAVGLLLLAGCYGLSPRTGAGTRTGVAEITDGRSSNNGAFDRVVFEFRRWRATRLGRPTGRAPLHTRWERKHGRGERPCVPGGAAVTGRCPHRLRRPEAVQPTGSPRGH